MNKVRKGISPIVAVVLLIAIAVIAAVGLYFWVGGLATKQPTPSTPKTITALCTGTTLTITNIGTETITEELFFGNSTSATTDDLLPGQTVIVPYVSGSGSVYGATTGAAQFNC
ncbi:MAG: type IV pilin [Candidatus Diapherotrites archaeon]|nr:type IV pilin [Candidatus Diapherotrites archaeon]